MRVTARAASENDVRGQMCYAAMFLYHSGKL